MDLSVVQEDMQKLKESKKMKTEKNNTIFASLVEESSSMHSKGAGVWILQKKKKKTTKAYTIQSYFTKIKTHVF